MPISLPQPALLAGLSRASLPPLISHGGGAPPPHYPSPEILHATADVEDLDPLGFLAAETRSTPIKSRRRSFYVLTKFLLPKTPR